jgi:hypothetical protein
MRLEPTTFDFFLGQGAELSPSQHLANYLRKYDNPPPLEALLDRILVRPSWNERDIAQYFPNPQKGESTEDYTMAKSRWLAEQYDGLFRRVDSILQALVSDPTANVDRLLIATPEIPSVFRREAGVIASDDKIELSGVVATWIKEQRMRDAESKERKSLIDTFFLLMVLGAFGSLIFLSKAYIEREDQNLAAYVFRPILGMFLAVAVFIIDIAAHSIISTANILQTRHETLFLLALAAGILSEQAYEVVSVRAKAVLGELRRKESSALRADDDVELGTKTGDAKSPPSE